MYIRLQKNSMTTCRPASVLILIYGRYIDARLDMYWLPVYIAVCLHKLVEPWIPVRRKTLLGASFSFLFTPSPGF